MLIHFTTATKIGHVTKSIEKKEQTVEQSERKRKETLTHIQKKHQHKSYRVFCFIDL